MFGTANDPIQFIQNDVQAIYLPGDRTDMSAKLYTLLTMRLDSKASVLHKRRGGAIFGIGNDPVGFFFWNDI